MREAYTESACVLATCFWLYMLLVTFLRVFEVHIWNELIVVESRPLAYSVSEMAQQILMNHGVRYLHPELAEKFFTSLGLSPPAPTRSPLSYHV